ncbi:MAG TPA: GTP-binding protein [Thermoleophilaceae bacterium]|nr:GTP-binding protein [Thermoleophilaceae bacterium]
MRVATAGSVDDGKSTLIGRLLLETKQIFEDQLEHVEAVSRDRGDGYVNLALLTDGLRAEREQGITIDVAYRYFQTPARKFILADTPGHEQYTRNMITGASTADVALILVDARHGVVEQSRRHALIASLLRIPHTVVCVNKMDLVGFEPAAFEEVAAQFPDADVIPISALHGDNVTERSARMHWYGGPALLELLEGVQVAGDRDLDEVRFPVQWVIRPMSDERHDYRGYAGTLAGGVLRPGDEVSVLPGGRASRVEAIDTADGELDEAFPPMSVTLRLEDDLDVSRGDMIVAAGEQLPESRELEATLCWMHERPLTAGARYRLKQTTRTVAARVDSIDARVDVNTLEEDQGATELLLNDIGRVRLRLGQPIFCDSYARNRITGSFILIDEATGDTAGAGMVL